MVKKLRYQDVQIQGRRRRARSYTRWLLEPRDGVLLGIAMAMALWLHWLVPLPS